MAADNPTDENSPMRWQIAPPATNLYSACKVIAEALAAMYLADHGLDYVALRYSAVYGERQHKRAVMGGHIAETCERIRRGSHRSLMATGFRFKTMSMRAMSLEPM